MTQVLQASSLETYDYKNINLHIAHFRMWHEACIPAVTPVTVCHIRPAGTVLLQYYATVHVWP